MRREPTGMNEHVPNDKGDDTKPDSNVCDGKLLVKPSQNYGNKCMEGEKLKSHKGFSSAATF